MPYYTLQVANMRKPQSFILYPYKGGEDITLQSDKRFAQVNLRTGEGYINNKNENYANSLSLFWNPIKFNLPEDIKTQIQAYLWHNEGREGNIGGILFYKNEELFSK